MLRFEVTHEMDRIWVGRKCAALARSQGFSERAAWKVSIAVSELVTNAVKYAGPAVVSARPIEAPRAGLEIVIEDDGGGFDDARAALSDGYSEGRMIAGENWTPGCRGLGTGLGAVARLMDDLKIENRRRGGARVTIRIWVS